MKPVPFNDRLSRTSNKRRRQSPVKIEINFRYLILLAAAAALGGVLFGFDIAIITGAGPFLMVHFGLDDLELGWAFSSLLFGCVLGLSLPAGLPTVTDESEFWLG